MKLSSCVLCLVLATATSAPSPQGYQSTIPVCGSFYGFTRTFPNVFQFLTDYIGKGWQILNTGPCPPVSQCQIYNPVCGVSLAGKYQTFLNSCLMQADQKVTGTAWQIKSLGICSYNPSYVSAAPTTIASASPYLTSTPLNITADQPLGDAIISEEPVAAPLDSSPSITDTVFVPELVRNVTEFVTFVAESSSSASSSNSSSSTTSTSSCQQTTVDVPVSTSNETVVVAQPTTAAPQPDTSLNITVTVPVETTYTQYQPTTYQSSVASSYYAPKAAQYQTSPVYVTSPQTPEGQFVTEMNGSVVFVPAPTSTSTTSTSSASATTTDNVTIPANLYEQLLRLYQVAVAAGKLPAAGTSYYQTYSKVGAP